MLRTSLILLAVFLAACTLTITPDTIIIQRGGGLPLITTATSTGIPPPSLITATLDPTPTQEIVRVACVTYAGGVNVRSGHSTQDAVIGVLRVNDCARWIAEAQGWYYIEWGSAYGWVAGWLMRME